MSSAASTASLAHVPAHSWSTAAMSVRCAATSARANSRRGRDGDEGQIRGIRDPY